MKRFLLLLTSTLLAGCVAVPYDSYPEYDAYGPAYGAYGYPATPYAAPYYDPFYVGPTFGFGVWGGDRFHGGGHHHWGGPGGHMNPGHGHMGGGR